MTIETGGRLLKHEKLAKYTSWRVGGPADQLYIPQDLQDLIGFIKTLPDDEPVFWMGLGSNLLVRDGGIRGTVINTKGRLKEMSLTGGRIGSIPIATLPTSKDGGSADDCREQSRPPSLVVGRIGSLPIATLPPSLAVDGLVYVEAGVPCAHVARFCGERGLTGAEFLAGIPGTMGGALKMNAGAFGGETWAIVKSVEMLDAVGKVTYRKPEDFKVSYRSVKGFDNEWFLACVLTLQQGDTVASQQKIKGLLEKRGATQPTNQPSCGSVFKNPEGDYAARLIEQTGLKGYAIGGACVSEKHANFIVNTGKATAADIEALIHYVQDKVEEQQGIMLQTEVCMVGEASAPRQLLHALPYLLHP